MLIKKVKAFFTQNTSSKQTVIKNTFWLFVAEAVSKGSLFIINMLIARKLGPDMYGMFSYVVSFVTVFSVIADFGLTTMMVRDASKDESVLKSHFVNGNALKVILGLVTLVIVGVVSLYYGRSDIPVMISLLYCGYVVLFSMGEYLRAFFRPMEKMQEEAFLKIFNGIVSILLIGYFLFWFGDMYHIVVGYFLAGIITLLVSVIYVIIRCKITSFKIDISYIKKMLKSGFYLLGGLIFIQIFVNTDQIILGYLGYDKELGIYSAMYRVVFVFTALSQVFVNALIPNIMKHYSFEKIKKSAYMLLGYSLSLFVFVLLFGKKIIFLLYGPHYLVGYTILLMHFATYIFISLDHLFYILLNSLGYEKKIFVFTMIAGAVNLGLNMFLIPMYQGIGAALTTFISEVLLLGLILFSYLKVLRQYKHE